MRWALLKSKGSQAERVKLRPFLKLNMKVKFGKGRTEFGPGVQIDLTGDEVALAIYAYLTAHDCHADEAATLTVNKETCTKARIYVDPSGGVVIKGVGWSGTGRKY